MVYYCYTNITMDKEADAGSSLSSHSDVGTSLTGIPQAALPCLGLYQIHGCGAEPNEPTLHTSSHRVVDNLGDLAVSSGIGEKTANEHE